MPSREELRLARAKAIAWSDKHLQSQATDPDDLWRRLSIKQRTAYVTHARAIEPADAALGVVSVPVKMTDAMKRAGFADADFAQELFAAMLAASPLAPEEPT